MLKYKPFVINTSLVAIFEGATVAPSDLVKSSGLHRLGSLFPAPFNISQQLVVADSQGGSSLAFEIESIRRSHRTISISPVRIEVSDSSEPEEFLYDELEQILSFVLAELKPSQVSAVGANQQMLAELSADAGTAGQSVAESFVTRDLALPTSLTVSSASVRIRLSGPHRVSATLNVEPRYQDPETNELWMHVNVNQDLTGSSWDESAAPLFAWAHELLESAASRYSVSVSDD